MKRIALALLLVASPAFATTFNVPSGSTLANAMANAVGGDIVNLAAGSYAASAVSPASSGSAGNYIRIIGNPAGYGTGVNLTGGGLTISKNYVSVNGVHLTGGGISISSAVYDSVNYCYADSGGLDVVGGTIADSSTVCHGHYVGNSTFHTSAVAGAWYAWRVRDASDCTFDHVRIYGYAYGTTTDARPGRYLYYARRNTFTDCYLAAELWGNSTSEQNCNNLRDYTQFNSFVRDTVWSNLTSKYDEGSKGSMLLAQQGNHPGTATDNSWTGCDYRAWGECVDFTDGTTRDAMRFCVIASAVGVPLVAPAVGASTFQNNTLYTRINHDTDNISAAVTGRLRGNVYFAKTANGSCQNWNIQVGWLAPTAGVSDSNYYAAYDTAQVFRPSGSCISLGSWVAANHNDPHSAQGLYTGTIFADTTWATLDLHPAASSVLVTGGAPGGTYGALFPASGTYTITATAGSGGTITPSGTDAVISGADAAYTVAPAAGYQLSSLTVDGWNVGALAAYTFPAVGANHAITAAFVPTASSASATQLLNPCYCGAR